MMKRLSFVLAIAITVAGCSREDALEMPAGGSDVAVQKKDGVTVEGKLIEVQPEQVIVESRGGVKTTVPRAQIAQVRTTTAPAENEKGEAEAGATGNTPAAEPSAVEPESTGAAPPATTEPRPAARVETDKPETKASAREADPEPAVREVTLPAGTVLPLTLRTSVGSATSNIEDQVRATLRSALRADGVEALPAGTAVVGHVTSAQRSARVKGRASVAFRFTRLDLPGEGGLTNIRTGTVSRTAEGTKKQDAAKIGGGAVGGAIIGGILGGGDGAAKGAAIGGAGGTGVVLATRGKEVSLAAGTPLSVKLTQPLTLRVRGR